MAAVVICAATAALLKDRTDTQAPPPAAPACESRTLAELATPPPGPLALVSSAHPPEPRQRPGQLVIGGCRISSILALLGIDVGPPVQIISNPVESVAGLADREWQRRIRGFGLRSRSMSFPPTRWSCCLAGPQPELHRDGRGAEQHSDAAA
jgi:hypothetical protein